MHHVFFASLLYQRRTTPQMITQLQIRQRATRMPPQWDLLQHSQKSMLSAMWPGPSFLGPTWIAAPQLVGTSLWNKMGRGCSPVKTLQIRSVQSGVKLAWKMSEYVMKHIFPKQFPWCSFASRLYQCYLWLLWCYSSFVIIQGGMQLMWLRIELRENVKRMQTHLCPQCVRWTWICFVKWQKLSGATRSAQTLDYIDVELQHYYSILRPLKQSWTQT